MALSLTREDYLLHKLHSLSGIIPVGFYMLQHLTLNSFTLAGPTYFNGVVGFFETIPPHILLGLEIVGLWLPLAFHAVYGLFITNRSQPNFFGTRYTWAQNRMYTFQRLSGMFLFFFLIYHVISTTGAKYYTGDVRTIEYAAWQAKLTANAYIMFVFYLIGVLSASYHLAYGVWNFCIRWGITISERAQRAVQRFSFGLFIVVTLLGWGALVGFLIHPPTNEDRPGQEEVRNEQPLQARR